MHDATVRGLGLDHGDPPRTGATEIRVRAVVGITLVTMVAEIAVGLMSGSKALEADGWHMGTHAGAIGLAAVAYWYGRTHGRDARFSFGAGKVHALAAWTNAVLLGVAATWIVVGSLWRLSHPETVNVREALPVAIFGLLVNVVCAWLLAPGSEATDDTASRPDSAHAHSHDHGHSHGHDHDLNRAGAYLHVLMDMLTSVAAIVALIAVSYTKWTFLDPVIGAIGGIMVVRWGAQLLRDSAAELLDAAPSDDELRRVRTRLEAIDDVRVADLHVWALGFGRRACMATVVTHLPRAPMVYRAAIREVIGVDHLTVEVHPCTPPCEPK